MTGTPENAKRWRGIGLLAVVAIGALIAWVYRGELRALEPWVERHGFIGAGVYVLSAAASVVLLPFSSLPLLPLAVRLWGVWLAGALSALGWWLGALVAFWIARLARSSLGRFASLEAIDRVERSVPADVGFAAIVVLRMVLPVDVTSFALGLLRNLRFTTYAVASLIGIVPFAFVWSYAGSLLGTRQYLLFAFVATLLIVAGLLVKRYWLKRPGADRTPRPSSIVHQGDRHD